MKLNKFEVSTTGYKAEVDPQEWAQEFIQHMVEYAAGVKLTRCTAGKSGTHDAHELREIRDKLIDNLNKGIVPASGGKKLTNEERAMKDVALSINGFSSIKGVNQSASLPKLVNELITWIKDKKGVDLTPEQVQTWLKSFGEYEEILERYNNPPKTGEDDLPDFVF